MLGRGTLRDAYPKAVVRKLTGLADFKVELEIELRDAIRRTSADLATGREGFGSENAPRALVKNN
jgi:hypothetical protein